MRVGREVSAWMVTVGGVGEEGCQYLNSDNVDRAWSLDSDSARRVST